MKRTRLFASAIALILMLPISMKAQQPWSGQWSAPIHGSGTSTNPYLIETAEHLAYLATAVSASNHYTNTYFKLTTDINLDYMNWTPIGKDESQYFAGHFDGDNHHISNLYISSDTLVYGGLFGVVNGGSISNINMRDCQMYRGNVARDLFWGGIAGMAKGADFSYCQISGTVQGIGKKANTESFVGGIIGNALRTTISHCSNNANVIGQSIYMAYAGGITGKASICTFTYCSNINSVAAQAPGQSISAFYAYAGGISGWLDDSRVDRSYNYAPVTAQSSPFNSTYNSYANAYAGGIVGRTTESAPYGVQITNSYNRGSIIATTPTGNINEYAGGLSGQNGAFENCYNTGSLTAHIRGGICAISCTGIPDPDTGVTNDNNYYPDDLNTNNPNSCGDPMPDSNMRDPNFPNILNNGDTSPNRPFQPDSTGYFNDGYPILYGQTYVVTLPPSDTLGHSLHLHGLCSQDPDSVGFYVWDPLSENVILYFDANDSVAFNAWADNLEDGTLYFFQAVVWIDDIPYLGNQLLCSTLDCSDTRYFSNFVTTETGCNSYTFQDHIFTTSVDTTFTYANRYQCDSTYVLHLTLDYTKYRTLNEVVCDAYTWSEGNGLTYTASTTVNDTLLRPYSGGCDSVTTLNLTVNYSSASRFSVTECDSYTWDNTTYQSTGVYEKHYYDVNNCDSTVTLSLTVRHSSDSTFTLTACDQYYWANNGRLYNASNRTDFVTYPNANIEGCDSTVRLNLTINYSNSAIDDQTSATTDHCDSYTWHGVTYTHSTNAPTYTCSNQWGCDSITTLHLVILNENEVPVIETVGGNGICDRYTWHGTTYGQSGRYYFDTVDQYGCQATHTLNLTLYQSTSRAQYENHCDSYTWANGNGQTYTTDQQLSHTFFGANSHGCDSTITLNLTVRHRSQSYDTVYACENYNWFGTTYHNSNDHLTHTIRNSVNCDSVLNLNLVVTPSTTPASPILACERYNWHGMVYSQDIAQSDSISYETYNQYGCTGKEYLVLTIVHDTAVYDTVTACDSYAWHPVAETTYNCTRSGVYSHTSPFRQVCNRTDRLTLTINRSNQSSHSATACDSMIWNGTTYTRSGNYQFTTLNTDNCDSTAHLQLTINPSKSTTVARSACNSLVWFDKTLTTSGAYSNTLSTDKGCDSVITLNLTVNHSYAHSDTVSTCDSYTWNGTAYTTSGTYTLNNTNIAGCDSVNTLYLTLGTTTSGTTQASTCGTYQWYGTTYQAPATAQVTYPNATGCTHTETLVLTKLPSYNDTLPQRFACDRYSWMDTTFTTAGHHYKTKHLYTSNGCDSLVTLNLTVTLSYAHSDTVSTCDSYTWNGTSYTTSGTYTLNNTNIAGCDSVNTLHLTLGNTTSGTTQASTCGTYTWYGTTYQAPATAQVTYPNATGCTHTETLVLTKLPSYNDTLPQRFACDRYSWMDTTFTTAGHHYKTKHLYTSNGCDSLVTLSLMLNQSTSTRLDTSVCDRYTWAIDGLMHDSTGTYTINTLNDNNCPHTDVLNLTVRRSSSSTEHASSCSAYTWNNESYSASGTYSLNNLTNAVGCDSTSTLIFTLLDNYEYSVAETVCDRYNWIDGQEHTTSGTYTVTLHTANGCDSIIHLNLTVNYGSNTTDVQRGCDSYTWIDGQTYTNSTSGIHAPKVITPAANGCYDTVTLQLTINPSYDITLAENVCDSYTLSGVTYDSTDVYTIQTTSAAGCDSTVTLYLIVRHTAHTYFDTFTDFSSHPVYWPFDGDAYAHSTTGVYDYTFDGAAANGCDSISTMNLTVLGKNLPRIVSYGNNILALDHYPYSENQQGTPLNFQHYQWYHNGEPIEGATNDYLAKHDFDIMYGSFYVMVSDDVTLPSTNWVPSNVIVFNDDSLAYELGSPVSMSLSPNPSKVGGAVQLSIDLNEDQMKGAVVNIYDLQGRMVHSYQPDQSESLFQNNFREGIYVVTVTTANGRRYTSRLVVK